jgi:hypothetical protein
MTTPRPDDAAALDAVRASVLDRMERGDRVMRGAIVVAALLEAGLFAVAFLYVDWKDHTQVLIFLLAALSYSIIALGMIALGGHVSRTVARVLAALDAQRELQRDTERSR